MEEQDKDLSHYPQAGETRKAQFPLPFSNASNRDWASFIVAPENQLAVEMLNAPTQWHNGTALMSGPPGSGKTHLLGAFASEYRVDVTPVDALAGELDGRLIVLDSLARLEDPPTGASPNAHAQAHQHQVALFHLLNRAMSGELFVLMASTKPAQRLNIGLADLRSRLAAASAASIGPPGEQLLAQLLMKHFADAQVEVRPAVIEFMVSRIEREYSAVSACVQKVNAAALAQARAITVPLVKEALGF